MALAAEEYVGLVAASVGGGVVSCLSSSALKSPRREVLLCTPTPQLSLSSSSPSPSAAASQLGLGRDEIAAVVGALCARSYVP